MTEQRETHRAGGGSRRAEEWLVGRGVLLERGPRRTLAVASFVNMTGSGVFMVSAGLFYTRSVGLSVAQVGLGMGVGGLVGLLSGIPVGHLADRRGPREVYLATLTVQGAVMATLVLVRSFWLFVVAVSLMQLAGSASQAARGPLVRGFAGPRPARFRAHLRATVNLAAASGAVFAALVVQLDSRAAYLCLVLGNALSFLAAAAVVRRLPRLAPVAVPSGTGRWTALKDGPYLLVTALDGVMSMQGTVLVFVMPLWIVGHTHAPRWLVGATVLLNTALVVAFQVRAGRGVDTGAAAAVVWRRSGWAFLAAMALAGVSGGMPGWAAAALLLSATAVHTLGELWQAAGSFELRYRLAPAHAQGQYSGVFRLGSGLAGVVAPSLLGLLCLSGGELGWLAAGGVFVAVGSAVPFAVRWAERTGAREAAAAG
ncbi:MFS transporter [Kitasatospora paranensis]|uniref:MFS transporter n=1 Tax=Kitasatospora paranensis TaxID=258053 RepID=A0ABW2G369_9ACTN